MMKSIVGVLFFELLLVHCATREVETKAHCNEDVTLECHGADFSKNYISVVWYKIDDERRGIIRKYKDAQEPEYYNNFRPTSLGERNSLIMANVTPIDSGIYECTVNANVGSKNFYRKVSLDVSDCATKLVPTSMTNILNTTQCSHRVEDLSIAWGVTGYLAVGVAKILLSLFTVWVIRRIGSRSRRHKRMQ